MTAQKAGARLAGSPALAAQDASDALLHPSAPSPDQAKVDDSDGHPGLTQELAPRRSGTGGQFWVLKCLYFLLTGSIAGLFKFLPVFFHNHGNSPSQIATLLTASSLASFTGGLFWGRLADKTGAYKQIIVVTALISSTLVFGFMWSEIESSFCMVLGLVTVFSVFNSSTGSLIDSITVLFVRESGGEQSYGEQRLWGALGWGTMSFVSGWLVDCTSMNAIFITFSSTMVITLTIVVRYFKNPPADAGEAKGEGLEGSAVNEEPACWLSRCVFHACGARELVERLLLFANLIVAGTLVAFVESFLFVYMTDVYDASQTLMGLCVLIMTAFELPVFLYSKWLLKNVGIKGLLTVAHMFYATRVVCYTVIPLDQPWMFMLLEPTHGLVFAGMWIASVELASRLAPPSEQGTMQALIGGLYYTLAVGVIGTNVAGFVVTWQGGGEKGYHALYRGGAAAMVGWSILWNTASFVQQRCTRADAVDDKQEGTDCASNRPSLTCH